MSVSDIRRDAHNNSPPVSRWRVEQPGTAEHPRLTHPNPITPFVVNFSPFYSPSVSQHARRNPQAKRVRIGIYLLPNAPRAEWNGSRSFPTTYLPAPPVSYCARVSFRHMTCIFRPEGQPISTFRNPNDDFEWFIELRVWITAFRMPPNRHKLSDAQWARIALF